MASPEVYRHSDLEVAPQHTVLHKPYREAVPNYGQQFPNQAPRKERTVWGIRMTTFFLTLALILVILATGIGGGVGGTMAANNAKNSNKAISIITTTVAATATARCASGTSFTPTTSTTPTALSVPTTGTLYLNCPSIDNTNLRITLQSTSLFTITCGQDFGGGFVDIVALTAYSLSDCARACASYNLNWRGDICKGATFNSNIGDSVAKNFGTCFSKNNTGAPTFSTEQSYAGLVLQ